MPFTTSSRPWLSLVIFIGAYAATPSSGPCIGAFAGLSRIAAAASGDVYMTDFAGSWVRVVHPDGSLAVFAGMAAPGAAGDGGQAIRATLRYPQGLAVLPSGDVLITDTGNSRVVRVFAANATLVTIAGRRRDANTYFSGSGGDGLSAIGVPLSSPSGIAVDADGNAFFCDNGNMAVRRVDAATGIITRVAGQYNMRGWAGNGGPATIATLTMPFGLAVASDGRVVIADSVTIRAVGADGIIVSLLGSAAAPPTGFGTITSVAIDGSGAVYFSSFTTHRVWMLPAAGGAPVLVAGTGVKGYTGDGGAASSATLNAPSGLAISGSALFVAETGGSLIRRVDLATGTLARVAGAVPSAAGEAPLAQSATMNGDVVTVSSDAFYLSTAPGYIERIRATDWRVSPVAGTGVCGFSGDGGPAINATIALQATPPTGTCESRAGDMVVTPSGDVFIADAFNMRIRRIAASTGEITTVVGERSPARRGRALPLACAARAG